MFMIMKFVMVMVRNGNLCFHLMFNNELTRSVLLSTWTDDICCMIAVHSLSFTHNSLVHDAGGTYLYHSDSENARKSVI